MNYTVYILQSDRIGRYYVGSCENIERRLKQHNIGKTKSTKDGIPWRIVFTEVHPTRQLAYKREKQIKSYKGGMAFKKLTRRRGRSRKAGPRYAVGGLRIRMYYVYILQSKLDNKFYIGYTRNLDERLKRHNTGRSTYTKHHMPWVLVYSEKFDDKIDAFRREREIKSYKGGLRFKKLIKL